MNNDKPQLVTNIPKPAKGVPPKQDKPNLSKPAGERPRPYAGAVRPPRKDPK